MARQNIGVRPQLLAKGAGPHTRYAARATRKSFFPRLMGGPGDAGFEYRRLMPRPPRLIFPGECYHVLNRANRRAEVFHHANDYRNFMKLMPRAQDRVPLDIFAACIMPNHLHPVVRPHEVLDITRWMQWLCTTHPRH